MHLQQPNIGHQSVYWLSATLLNFFLRLRCSVPTLAVDGFVHALSQQHQSASPDHVPRDTLRKVFGRAADELSAVQLQHQQDVSRRMGIEANPLTACVVCDGTVQGGGERSYAGRLHCSCSEVPCQLPLADVWLVMQESCIQSVQMAALSSRLYTSRAQPPPILHHSRISLCLMVTLSSVQHRHQSFLLQPHSSAMTSMQTESSAVNAQSLISQVAMQSQDAAFPWPSTATWTQQARYAGIFATCCRHGIVLKALNMVTGEKWAYATLLMDDLLLHSIVPRFFWCALAQEI